MIYEAMIEGWVIPASLMIAAVLAIRFLLRGKISLRLQYALWAVVLVRLLIPFLLFVSPISADSVTEKLEIPEAIHQVYFSANEEEYERQYAASYHETVRFYESKGKPLDPVVAEQQAAAVARQSIELDLQWKLFNLWLGGMALMTAVIVACNVHLAHQLRKRRYALDVPACLLPVYVTEAVPTPCVFGFFRPAIYLTPDAAKGSQVRAHVLEHELTHYRHGDHIWSVLRSLCLVLHWYNPLVWIAAKVSRADAELACDEGALARLGESQRGDYGRTLIGLTCSAPISELLLTATTMTGSAGSIRERIKLLMKRPRNTILTITAVILLVTLIVGCTFSATPNTAPPATEPTGPSVPEGSLPEATIPGVDNDMAYTDQDLPIPEAPSPLVAISETVKEFTQAYQENIWLGRDNNYDHLTVLAADPEMTVPYGGGTAALSSFHKNIQYLHDKELYWKHERQDSGILENTFAVNTNRHLNMADGVATVQVDVSVTFYYADSPGPSGLGSSYEITLVQADGKWLIADVLELNDWFDADYKNNPYFDVEKLISN